MQAEASGSNPGTHSPCEWFGLPCPLGTPPPPPPPRATPRPSELVSFPRRRCVWGGQAACTFLCGSPGAPVQQPPFFLPFLNLKVTPLEASDVELTLS